MTSEHGGCCCNHNDPHDNHDQQDTVVHTPHIVTVPASAGCCGGAKEAEMSRSNDHAGHSTATASPS